MFPYLGRFLIQRLVRFPIWQLFLPTAARIIAGTSYFCIGEIVARGKYISTCVFTYSVYFHGDCLFLGIHTCSDLVCLEILGHLSNPILSCLKEWDPHTCVSGSSPSRSC